MSVLVKVMSEILNLFLVRLSTVTGSAVSVLASLILYVSPPLSTQYL